MQILDNPHVVSFESHTIMLIRSKKAVLKDFTLSSMIVEFYSTKH